MKISSFLYDLSISDVRCRFSICCFVYVSVFFIVFKRELRFILASCSLVSTVLCFTIFLFSLLISKIMNDSFLLLFYFSVYVSTIYACKNRLTLAQRTVFLCVFLFLRLLFFTLSVTHESREIRKSQTNTTFFLTEV